MGVAIHVTSGPAIERAGDLAAMLSPARRGRRAVHRRDPPAARASSKRSSTRRWRTSRSTSCWARARRPGRSASTCPRFTLVGATTRTGSITGPLRDRFGLVARLDYYEPDDLEAIVTRAAGILGVQRRRRRAPARSPGRARGTPRIANRLLRRVRDFAEVKGDGTVDLRHRVRRAGHLRRRRARPRQGRPRHPVGHLRALRRRPGRAVDARHQRGRADRDRRGRLRAVPHPGRPAHAHAPRARAPPRPPSPTSASPRPRHVPGERPAARPLRLIRLAASPRSGHWWRPWTPPPSTTTCPPSAIAQTPVEPRDAARLLVDDGRRSAARGTATSPTCRRWSGPATSSW